MNSWKTATGTRIIRISGTISNQYLVLTDTMALLVDSGRKGDRGSLLRQLTAQVDHLDYLILTHTHFDHAGNADLIKSKFNPYVVVHHSEAAYLESGSSPLPQGTLPLTRLIYNSGARRPSVQHLFRTDPVKPDILTYEEWRPNAADDRLSLIHTPGHTQGSMALVIDQEIAITGDSMVNVIPGRIFPPWADDVALLFRTWEKLLDTDCRIFLPAHGRSITRKWLEKEYARKTG